MSLNTSMTQYHAVWVKASEAGAPTLLDFPTQAAAVSFRHQLYRWRKKNTELCSPDILAMTVSIIPAGLGFALRFQRGIDVDALRLEE